MLFFLGDPAGNTFGRAAFEEELFDSYPELFVLHNLHSLILGVLSIHVRFVDRLLGIVPSANGVSCNLVGDGGDAPLKGPCNGSQRVLFLEEKTNLVPLAALQFRCALFLSAFLWFFSSTHFNRVFGFICGFGFAGGQE